MPVLATARTFTLDGIAARPVRVEVDVHRGLPGFAIVGLPDAAVREARERVRAALVNCGFEFPLQRIVVNLAPASLRKAGPGMDLAIAAALLLRLRAARLGGDGAGRLAGELALDGQMRPINGALAIAEAAREGGAEAIVAARRERPRGGARGRGRGRAAGSLAGLPALAAGERRRRPRRCGCRLEPPPGAPDLADLRGQPHLRHALEVAAAGGHSLLMIGPPGAGKSLAASRLPSILPPLRRAEALEVARIASATGRLGAGIPAGRPFRAPHHTISAAGLIGGGDAAAARRGHPRPSRRPLPRRALRVPPRRAGGAAGAARERRGGDRPGEREAAAALPLHARRRLQPVPLRARRGRPRLHLPRRPVQRYQGKLSGALADRIDLLVAVAQPAAAEIGGPPGEPSAAVRDRVCAARERQEARLGPGRCNAEMTPAEARECALDPAAAALLADLYARRRLSGRAHDRALRLARTVADLAGATRIGEEEMAQALQLRRRDRV